MRTEYGKIEEDLRLADHLRLHGMVTGDAHVLKGATLELFGTCCRGLYLQDGSVVKLHGKVIGSVSNLGGTLSISGVVKGNVTTGAGATEIESEAVVEGTVRDDT